MILSAAGVAAVLCLLRLRAPTWAFLLLGLVPLAVLLRDEVRIYSYHGLMHASILYRILAEGIPPTDPFVAGGTLHYPWAHHALLALAVRVGDLSPPTAFALFNVGALAATLYALHRVSARLGDDRRARVLGVLLAVYGVSPFFRGPFAAIDPASPLAELKRIVPLEKFLNVNNNQAGLMCAAFFLVALTSWKGYRYDAASLATLFVVTVAVGFLYPVLWLPMMLCAFVWGAILVYRARTRWSGIAVWAVSCAASLATLPYLRSLAGARQPALSIDLSPEHLLLTARASMLALGAAGVLAATQRRGWCSVSDERRFALSFMGVATLVPLSLFVVTHAPIYAEYKFLALASMGAGLLLGVPLSALLDVRPWLVSALLWLLLLPISAQIGEVLESDLGDPTVIVEEGALLQPFDHPERELHDWIRRETEACAVFFDSSLKIPVHSHRRLYVAFDPRRRGDLAGWGMLPSHLLTGSFGHTPRELRERRALATSLLGPKGPLPAGDLLGRIQSASGPCDVYVVARSRGAIARLDSDVRFARRFGRTPPAVFQIVESREVIP